MGRRVYLGLPTPDAPANLSNDRCYYDADAIAFFSFRSVAVGPAGKSRVRPGRATWTVF
ncbi:MAG: hypothetical protein Q4B08_06530 [Propionibacteriaceae bacterium]|nr:hypothetical protein [Propionibacteriaceae bacterium]